MEDVAVKAWDRWLAAIKWPLPSTPDCCGSEVHGVGLTRLDFGRDTLAPRLGLCAAHKRKPLTIPGLT